MDTISVTVKFNRMLKGADIDYLENKKFIKFKGHGKRDASTAIFKISYPKFIGRNNATLVHESMTVLDCNKAFVDALRFLRPEDNITIKINRIDIPYTILMDEGETFNSYKGVFYIMASIFDMKFPNTAIKSINNFLDDQVETLILADAENAKNYNNKITIYNQYKRFIDTHPDEVSKTLKEHPDLPRRIRIEVSKKINILPIPIEEFATKDLYKEYNNKFLEYAINNLFDQECFERYRNSKLIKWVGIFQQKTNLPYSSLGWIYFKVGDYYEVIREALVIAKTNSKTCESAITSMRKIIREIEVNKGYQISNVLPHSNKIYKSLEKYKNKTQ